MRGEPVRGRELAPHVAALMRATRERASSPLPLWERVRSECQLAFALFTKDARRKAPGYAEAKPSEGGGGVPFRKDSNEAKPLTRPILTSFGSSTLSHKGRGWAGACGPRLPRHP